jgi:hypothetical protein
MVSTRRLLDAPDLQSPAAMSPDGTSVATAIGNGDTVRVVALSQAEARLPRYVLTHPTSRVTRLVWEPELGGLFAVHSVSGGPNAGRSLLSYIDADGHWHELTEAQDAFLSPDGRRFALVTRRYTQNCWLIDVAKDAMPAP